MASADAGVAMPAVERIATKKCPAKIAGVKLRPEHGFEGHVELTGCPESENGEAAPARPGEKTKAMLTLFDAKGKKKHEVEVLDEENQTDSLRVEDLFGTGRPVFLVTTTVPTMGSYGGPTTSFYELAGERFVPISIAAKDGGLEPISLVSAINTTWWLYPARSKTGQDIFEIRSSMAGATVGYRYAFEKGRWTVHSGPLVKWTGEHLKDTEAEFR